VGGNKKLGSVADDTYTTPRSIFEAYFQMNGGSTYRSPLEPIINLRWLLLIITIRQHDFNSGYSLLLRHSTLDKVMPCCFLAPMVAWTNNHRFRRRTGVVRKPLVPAVGVINLI